MLSGGKEARNFLSSALGHVAVAPLPHTFPSSAKGSALSAPEDKSECERVLG